MHEDRTLRYINFKIKKKECNLMFFRKGEGMEEKEKAKTVGTIFAMLRPA